MNCVCCDKKVDRCAKCVYYGENKKSFHCVSPHCGEHL